MGRVDAYAYRELALARAHSGLARQPARVELVRDTADRVLLLAAQSE
jgi:hypothetical protein